MKNFQVSVFPKPTLFFRGEIKIYSLFLNTTLAREFRTKQITLYENATPCLYSVYSGSNFQALFFLIDSIKLCALFI